MIFLKDSMFSKMHFSRPGFVDLFFFAFSKIVLIYFSVFKNSLFSKMIFSVFKNALFQFYSFVLFFYFALGILISI